jgi:hypothetical protein
MIIPILKNKWLIYFSQTLFLTINLIFLSEIISKTNSPQIEIQGLNNFQEEGQDFLYLSTNLLERVEMQS